MVLNFWNCWIVSSTFWGVTHVTFWWAMVLITLKFSEVKCACDCFRTIMCILGYQRLSVTKMCMWLCQNNHVHTWSSGFKNMPVIVLEQSHAYLVSVFKMCMWLFQNNLGLAAFTNNFILSFLFYMMVINMHRKR